MPKFTKGSNWDGKSTIGRRVYGNHDSKLTWDEVVALIKELDTLSGFGSGDGFSVAKPRGIPQKIWDLAEALRKPDTGVVVEKGIHQRDTAAHIRIILSKGSASYHVNLSAAPSAGVGEFNWKTVGITFVTASAHGMQTWPATYTQTPPGRGRRGSISIGTLPPAPAVAPVVAGTP
jgi:hypothetical protein